MKRIQNHYYQQRILILLAPLLLIAIVIWFFDQKNTPFLHHESRQTIIYVTSTLLPLVLALLITLVVPIKNRAVQLITTACAYLILISLMHYFTYNHMDYTIICTLSAASNVLVFLSKNSETNNKIISSLVRWLLALTLPIIIAVLIYAVLTQINVFIRALFNSYIINTNYSFIIVPIFTVLQAFGFHDELALMVSAHLKPSISTAFHNTILIVNFVVLPVAIFVKSLFAHNTLRIFLIFLGACCILCASIGTSISFILIFILIFFPGTFACIMLNEIILFFLSLHLHFSPLIRGTNFYRPDINLNYTNIFYNIDELTIFILIAILLPITLLLIFFNTSFNNFAEQRTKRKRQRFSYEKHLPLDLQIIVLLRALGGIDNIKFINLQDKCLHISVYDQHEVIAQTLSNMCKHKVGFDKVKKSYTCNFGKNTTLIHDKLIKLLGDFLGSSFQEVGLAPAFIINNISTKTN